MTINTKYEISLKEYFLILLEKILDIFLNINAFQRYVNRRANTKYGSKFITNNIAVIDDVFQDYHFDDIQKTDVVLDIGANIGGFSLFVSKFKKSIFCRTNDT